MGLFSLTQELAIDLGTANTLIMHNGKAFAPIKRLLYEREHLLEVSYDPKQVA